jgi:AP-1 complex subunit beta-1
LLELIQTKVNYVVQEAIIVIKDIFRKYPNKYESIIATLCENLDTLDEPEAKAAMIWIIGEYSDRIDNAPELLESFVEHFEDEQAQVQLQLLTAIVKLFLKRPEDAKELVGNVLNLATSHADNPDLRDRGYVYWRLLSTDPEAAQSVVLAQKPTITDDTYQMDPKLLNVLVANISTLSSIYHKPPEAFVKEHRTGALRRKEDDEDDDSDDGGDSEAMDDDEDEDDDDEDSDEDESPRKSAPSKPAASSSGGALDLLNLGGLSLEPSKPSNSGSADFDIFGTSAPAPAPVSIPSEEPLVPTLPASAGKSLAITSRVTRRGGQIFLDLQLENHTQQTLSKFAVKFNDNFLGLAPTGPFAPGAIAVGGSTKFALLLGVSKPPVSNNHGLIQIAIKTETDIVYLNQPVHAGVLFTEDGRLGDQEFLRYWKEIPDSNETIQPINMSSAPTPDQLKTRLGPFNVFYVASRVVNKATGGQASYFSLFFNNTKCLLEVKVDSGKVQACVKSGNKEYSQEVLRAITTILSR